MNNFFKFKQIFAILMLLGVVTNAGAVITNGEYSRTDKIDLEKASSMTTVAKKTGVGLAAVGLMGAVLRGRPYLRSGIEAIGLAVSVSVVIYALKKRHDARKKQAADVAISDCR